MRTSGSGRSISWLLLATLGAPWPVLARQAPADPSVADDAAGSARIEGRILEADGKTPVPGAVVRACYLEGDLTFASAPTGPGGEYEIAALPPGYADLTVETQGGYFLANQVLSFVPTGKIVADFVLRKNEGEPSAPIAVGGQGQTACGAQNLQGSAEIAQKKTTKDFVRSPMGIALIAGGAGVLLLVAASGGDESPASQFTP